MFLSEKLTLATAGKLQTTPIPEDNFTKAHLLAEITYTLGDIEIKRQMRIFPGIAAIQTVYFLKGPTASPWQAPVQDAGLEMIESTVLTKNNIPPLLGTIPLEGNHWKVEVIRFTDATDHHNSLVQKEEYMAFRNPVTTSGNLLFARNLLSSQRILVLKESPAGHSQQAYPGFDFSFSQQHISIAGIGIAPENLSADKWVESYSFVVALSGSDEAEQLKTLRQYQKAMRLYDSARDHMRMVNTWGDRSKDSRMNEAFILKEIQSAARLGLTHVQLDDGWQAGLSRNSASADGKLWDQWSAASWQPHPIRFPKGFAPVVNEARKHTIRLGLWFNPSKKDCYASWEQDADLLISYFKNYDFRVIKIDGIELACKESEERLQKLFDKVIKASDGKVSFNLDVTAGRRPGFNYFSRYGNIFLENRYTDWANYYPHWTLRNLWQLSRYIPAEKLQIEFLNKWRNAHKYPANDPLAPAAIPFDYLAAISLMGQPLAWMETSNLPEEAFLVSDLLKRYAKIEKDLHTGIILPMGHEPSGLAWTGFQSIGVNGGYVLVFREYNDQEKALIPTWLPANTSVRFETIAGHGASFSARTNAHSAVEFSLPGKHTFALYKYILE